MYKLYSKMPLWRGLMYHSITYYTVMTVAESESDIRIVKYTPYIAFTGELWVVFCEDFRENWPRYNDIALYMA